MPSVDIASFDIVRSDDPKRAEVSVALDISFTEKEIEDKDEFDLAIRLWGMDSAQESKFPTQKLLARFRFGTPLETTKRIVASKVVHRWKETQRVSWERLDEDPGSPNYVPDDNKDWDFQEDEIRAEAVLTTVTSGPISKQYTASQLRKITI